MRYFAQVVQSALILYFLMSHLSPTIPLPTTQQPQIPDEYNDTIVNAEEPSEPNTETEETSSNTNTPSNTPSTSSSSETDEEETNTHIQQAPIINTDYDEQINTQNGFTPDNSTSTSSSNNTSPIKHSTDTDSSTDSSTSSDTESNSSSTHSSSSLSSLSSTTKTKTTLQEITDNEPHLKYQRLAGDITNALLTDRAISLTSHQRFLVLGMQSGWIFILDPHGDIVRKYRPHKSHAINDISIDTNGDYIATCASDGRVVIRDIFKDTQTIHNFRNQDLLSIELHPNYKQQNMFVTGGRGQQLLLRTIGFFRSDNKVLHSGEGSVTCIAWKRDLIAWSNDRGVKIYDIEGCKPIAHINRSIKGSPDPEMFKCCLCWEDESTLLIGWGDWVKIGRIREVVVGGVVSREVHVTNVFITDFKICGIAPFREHLVLLAFFDGDESESESGEEEEEDGSCCGTGNSRAPELRIVSRRGHWIATDALPIHGYKDNQACDYKLVWSYDDVVVNNNHHNSNTNNSVTRVYDESFYIISPVDIVAALPRTTEDHIKYLWDHQQYEKAWREAVKHEDELQRTNLNPTDLGEEFLRWCLEQNPNSHSRFHGLCEEVCRTSADLWEKWIKILAGKTKLHLISNVVPLVNPTLDAQSYELVLSSMIKSDHRRFLSSIMHWDPNIYDIKLILTTATNHLNEIRTSDYLVQALSELHRINEDYDKSLEYYLQLSQQLLSRIPHKYNIQWLTNGCRDEWQDEVKVDEECEDNKLIIEELGKIKHNVFHMIVGEDLYEHIKDKIISLIELDLHESVRLFAEHTSEINPGHVYKQYQLRLEKIDLQLRLRSGSAVGSSAGNNELLPRTRSQSHSQSLHLHLSKNTLHFDNNLRNTNFTLKQFAQYRKYLKFFMYRYLHELIFAHNKINEFPEFHDILVSLYSEFDCKNLLNFLELSHNITYPKAHRICQTRLSIVKNEKSKVCLYNCIVFILQRMGNFNEALLIILIKLKNVSKAVKFVEEQNDKSLWNKLVERILCDANNLVPQLLDAVKGHPKVDARDLIEKIDPNLSIIGLKYKIIALFEEYSREKSVTKGTTNILRNDCLKLSQKLRIFAAKGIVVNINESVINQRVGKKFINLKNGQQFIDCSGNKFGTDIYLNMENIMFETTKDNGGLCCICKAPLKTYPSYYKQMQARLQKITKYQKLRHMRKLLEKEKSATSATSFIPDFFRNRSESPLFNAEEEEVGGLQVVNEESVEMKNNGNLKNRKIISRRDRKELIGETRLKLFGKKNVHIMDENDINIERNFPDLTAFFCGHFYHSDCYIESLEKSANFFMKSSANDEGVDKCLLCCSGQKRRF